MDIYRHGYKIHIIIAVMNTIMSVKYLHPLMITVLILTTTAEECIILYYGLLLIMDNAVSMLHSNRVVYKV